MLLCVMGPTASGKTGLAIQLALSLDGEVVSCDSMQVYRGMDIGTSKPAEAERHGVPHHMLDVADPSEPYSAAQYAGQASACIESIRARGRLPIVCGGTGLYFDALLYGLHGIGGCGGHMRQELAGRAGREGLAPLYAELARVDPESASYISANDERRIIRALEVYHSTGVPLSRHHEISKSKPPRYGDALLLGIRFRDRAALYERIDRRVDGMMAEGLLDEVRALLERQPPPSHTAMQAIGYKELAAALRGEITVEDAAAQIKQSTRRYAKRQITWFRKYPDIRWIEAG